MPETRSGLPRLPPKATSMTAKISNALMMHQHWNLSIRTAAEYAGVSPSALYRYLYCDYALSFSKTIACRALRPKESGGGKGRNPILSDKGLVKLADIITERAMDLKAIPSALFHEAVQSVVKDELPNTYAHVEISERSLRRLRSKVDAIVKNGKKRNKSRSAAFTNIRNAISMCTMFSWIHENVHRSLIFSSDDVSVLLNGWDDKPLVITSAKAEQYLKTINITTGLEEEEEKQRVVKFNCTISGDYFLTVSVIKFGDKSFSDFGSTPRVIFLGHGLYVCLYLYGIPEIIVEKYVYKLCIIREVMNRRDELKKSQAEGPCEMIMSQEDEIRLTDSFSESLEAPRIANRDNNSYEFISLCSDGATPQIRAIEDYLQPRNIELIQKLIFPKYSGGCSLSQSGNDNGHCHDAFHRLFKSPKYKYSEIVEPDENNWLYLRQLMQTRMEPASFRTVWKCMKSAPIILDKAFTRSNIKSAFASTGAIMPGKH